MNDIIPSRAPGRGSVPSVGSRHGAAAEWSREAGPSRGKWSRTDSAATPLGLLLGSAQLPGIDQTFCTQVIQQQHQPQIFSIPCKYFLSGLLSLASCWSPCPQCCYPLVLQEDGGAVYLLAVALYDGCTASAPLRLLTAGPSTWPSDGYSQHCTAGPARPAHQGPSLFGTRATLTTTS